MTSANNKRYFVHLTAERGCDYSIACGQKLVELPFGQVRDLDHAKELAGELFGDNFEHRIETVLVLVVSEVHELDVGELTRQVRAAEAEIERNRLEAFEKQQLARLLKKYGGGQQQDKEATQP